MQKDYQKILKAIEDIDNGDYNLGMLQNAMNSYCGACDICHGYKEALKETLNDQYQNHLQDQETDSLDELKRILNIK